MTRRPSRHPSLDILERLFSDVDRLVGSAREHPPSNQARQRIDSGVQELVSHLQGLTTELDPIKQPEFVFDPGDPAVVGKFVALGLIAQPRAPLATFERFYGSGVYAIYHTGEFAPYRPISETETPIYVGKADPQADHARTPLEQGDRLSRRLRDHRRAIGKASTTLDIGDFECRVLVVQSGWQGAAEDHLIDLFRPVWNSETDICYGLGKHGDDPETRSNLRSPWDTLHPGRDWAHRDPNMKDARSPKRIRDDLRSHFARTRLFTTVDEVLMAFFEGLRQRD